MKFSKILPGSILTLASAAFCSLTWAQDLDLESEEARISYALGFNVGGNIRSQGILEDLDLEAILEGIRDAAEGRQKLSDEEMVASIQSFSDQQRAKIQAENAALDQANKDFLTSNATKEGVMSTESGLQYQVLSSGNDGAAMPGATDTVEVHYHGTLIDGTVFDSSIERGESVSFALNQVIPGWTEGLQLMHVGDKYRFFIPSELGYGASGAGQVIPPNATLVFDVELLGIQ